MTRLISFLLLTNFSLFAQSITLQNLLQSATSNSQRLKIYNTDEKIEVTRLDTVYEQFYPKLSASYNTEYNRDESDIPGGTESVGDTIITSGTRYQSSLSLNLNYELYHFGTSTKNLEITEKEIQIKHLQWCEEEKKLHQNILERYNSALKTKVRSTLKDKMLSLRQNLFIIKKRLYRAGKYSKVDLGDEAITIIDLEREIELSMLQYEEDVIQLSSLSYVELDEKETKLMPIGYQFIDTLADSFEDTTQGQRYSKTISQKEDEISMLKRSQYPTIGMYGNYYFYGSDPVDAYESFEEITKNSWKLGLSIRMSIFEGFKYNNDSDRLRLELQRVKLERDLSQREYEYDAKAKINKIIYIKSVEEKDQKLHNKSQEKLKMIERLRKSHQVDKVSEINANLENLERELNLKIEEYEVAFENASLNILYRRADQCTQH